MKTIPAFSAEIAAYISSIEPAVTVRVFAGLFCLIAGALFLALVLEHDRRRVRVDPHAEPYGDGPYCEGFGFTAEQLAEFRGHLTPSSFDPQRRSLSYPRFAASDGVALQSDWRRSLSSRGTPRAGSGAPAAGVGDPSIPSIGTAGARNLSRWS